MGGGEGMQGWREGRREGEQSKRAREREKGGGGRREYYYECVCV